METKTKRPPCLGEWTCAHWSGERIGGFSSVQSRLTHGDNPEHSRVFTAGVMPDGECVERHDVALERWIHEVMTSAGCVPATPEGHDDA